jgi:hypothetical protein
MGELGPAGIIEHETRGAPSRIVITKSWHKGCVRSILQTLIENPNDAYAYWGLSEAGRMRGDTRGATAASSLFEGVFIGPRAGMTAMSL